MSDNTDFHKVIEVELEYIKRSVDDIKQRLDAHYVRREEFEPVKKVVYGMVSVMLMTIVGALVALVLK